MEVVAIGLVSRVVVPVETQSWQNRLCRSRRMTSEEGLDRDAILGSRARWKDPRSCMEITDMT